MNPPEFDSPHAAEAAFYAAFERADLAAMMAVWAPDDSIECVHPMGERLQGRAAVERSWRDIFSGGAGLKFALSQVVCRGDAEVSVHCVHEDISYGPGFKQRSRVICTNVYQHTDAGWRLVLHHASPGVLVSAESTPPAQTVH